MIPLNWCEFQARASGIFFTQLATTATVELLINVSQESLQAFFLRTRFYSTAELTFQMLKNSPKAIYQTSSSQSHASFSSIPPPLSQSEYLEGAKYFERQQLALNEDALYGSGGCSGSRGLSSNLAFNGEGTRKILWSCLA